MSTPSQRLAELGLELPPVVAPVAAYIPSTTSGKLVFTSGQLPMVDGALPVAGKLGAELDVETGYAQARVCGLNALAALAAAAGGLDAVERIVKVTIFVASAPDFTDHPKVGNGASELFGEVFGENGRHARSAVGVAALPLNAPVEVEVIGQLA
ncbi:RidA family protein [Naumannella halotolerans]|uniref:Enamine deaminase RidA (YjgF/YER057c/UK114 family) n=1 Tax=Naumannella halotolerans TaxID=993414 RepID=A0A4R7IYT9_9ACTN|nr:RidA family protein [Naumannella halotolerans]TDT29865.1 enamine deaminase RidA (YjgF/YER057c/UK114 family) [Naumannella halotolerans]